MMHGQQSRLRGEALEERLIFGLSFAVFLVVAGIARLLPRPWRPGQRSAYHRSIIAEARAAASTVVPFAFMG